MQSAPTGGTLQLPSPLHFVILDEVDQILVDRARQTNLLSMPESSQMTEEITDCVRIATRLAQQLARAHLWVRRRCTQMRMQADPAAGPTSSTRWLACPRCHWHIPLALLLPPGWRGMQAALQGPC